MKENICRFILFGLVMLVAVPVVAGEIVYNRYNLHVYEHTDRNGTVYKANYSGFVDPPAAANHLIIPPGTAMTVGEWRQGFTLTRKKDGRLIYYEFNSRNMKIPLDEYISLVTSAKPETLKGLNKTDQKGIKSGKALPGMTRNGVLTALGYPAKHKTPSLDEKKWTYWKDRWRTLVVEFGGNGKVARVIE